MFTDKIEPTIYNGVATTGGKYLIQKGIVTVIWSWTDYEGKLHTRRFNNVLYFPDSPVNILSATALPEFIKDDEVTWLLTKIKYTIFTWDFGRYKKAMAHSENILP